MLKFLRLAYKNAFGNLWRTLLIGFFIFTSSFIMVFVNCWSDSIKDSMINFFTRALTGHIQIRSVDSKEKDIVSMDANWTEIAPITGDTIKTIETIIGKDNQITNYTSRIRYNGMLLSDSGKKTGLFVGLNTDIAEFKDAMEIVSGQGFSKAPYHEVLLTPKQAEALKVKAGDQIGLITQTYEGYIIDISLKVAGIARIKGFSTFGFDVSFVDLETAREMIGFSEGEATDMIIYLENKEQTLSIQKNLESALAAAGLESKVKLSNWTEMGGFIQGFFLFVAAIFYGLISSMMLIIFILIINLLLITALDRFKEIGTMRAIGFSRKQIIVIFMSEITIINTIFTLLGIILATVLVLIFSKTGLPAFFEQFELAYGGKLLYMKFNILYVFTTFGLNMLISILATFYPANFASKMNPVKALQN